MGLLNDISQGLAIGIFAAISVIYTFQTRVAYPLWMLQMYDKPWVFLIIVLAAILVFYYYPVIGALLILLLGAVWMDGLLFARPASTFASQLNENAHIAGVPSHDNKVEVYPYSEPMERRIPESDTYGPSVDAISLPEPMYPVFYGLGDLSPGPAPFV